MTVFSRKSEQNAGVSITNATYHAAFEALLGSDRCNEQLSLCVVLPACANSRSEADRKALQSRIESDGSVVVFVTMANAAKFFPDEVMDVLEYLYPDYLPVPTAAR